MADFWVFGYGSLMWRPGFAHLERRMARLSGYHRALCIHSHVHRGTPERPGLVLGLDRGGSCRGIGFRVAGGDRDEVLAYLRARELVTSVYIETHHPIRFDDGSRAEAVTYIVDRTHGQYAGRIDPQAAIGIVRGAVGQSGPNEDYVINTVEHLKSLGIRDRGLETIAAQVAA